MEIRRDACDTGVNRVAEASHFDPPWGIGLRANNKIAVTDDSGMVTITAAPLNSESAVIPSLTLRSDPQKPCSSPFSTSSILPSNPLEV